MQWLIHVAHELLGTTIWEAIAVILALAYLVLAVRKSLWCWMCAFISSAIYVVLMFEAGLVMETCLNIFYVIMAVYGYVEWRRGTRDDAEMVTVRWRWQQHVIGMAAVLAATVVNALYLQLHVQAARSPWWDSFITWGSVLTTFMVARRVIDNWLYWIVIDSIAAVLYYSRGLVATSVLFMIYVAMVLYGYWRWHQFQSESVAIESMLP